MNHFKAIFLVGGPGSGKDFLLHSVFNEHRLTELSLERTFKAIVDQKNIEELHNFRSVIVNGNADNKDKIIVTKAVLEQMGYDTSMVFVYTSDEASKVRNDLRISKGAKTVSESVRSLKYNHSIQNMHDFSEMFEAFALYDNSNNFLTVSEEKKQEITGWIMELSETVSGFLKAFPKNESSLKWLSERVLEVGTKSTARFAKNLTPGQGSNRVRTYKQADKMTSDIGRSGTARSDVNMTNRPCVDEAKKSTKKSLLPQVKGYDYNRTNTTGTPGDSTGVASVTAGVSEEKKLKKKKKEREQYPEAPLSSGQASVSNLGGLSLVSPFGQTG